MKGVNIFGILIVGIVSASILQVYGKNGTLLESEKKSISTQRTPSFERRGSGNGKQRSISKSDSDKKFDIYVVYEYEDDEESDNESTSAHQDDEDHEKRDFPPVFWSLSQPIPKERNRKGSVNANLDSAKKHPSTSVEVENEKKLRTKESSRVYWPANQPILKPRNRGKQNINIGVADKSSPAGTNKTKVVTNTAKAKNAVVSSSTKNAVDSTSKSETSASDTCLTRECTLAAADIIRSMDSSVKPCDNFYKFACGGWIKNNPIPSESQSWSQFHLLEEKLRKNIKEILERKVDNNEPSPTKLAKKFYTSCQKKDPLKDLPTHLNRLSKKYLADFDGTVKRKHLGKSLGTLRREVGGDYIVSLYVGLDDKNTSRYAIYLDQPSLAIDRVYHVEGSDNENYKAHVQTVEKYWSLVYSEDDVSASKIAEDIMDFENSIASIMTGPEEMRNETGFYNPYTLREFSDKMGPVTTINFTEYIYEIFKEVQETEDVDLGDPSNLMIIVRDKSYFDKLGGVLKEMMTSKNHILENYLKWRIIYDYGIIQTRRLPEAGFHFLKKSNRPKASEDRNTFCADLTNSYFGMAISYHFVKEGFSGNFQEQIKDMVSNLMSAFYDIITETDWISRDETREKAKLKSEKMTPFIGYPDWLLNNSALINHYKGVEFSKSGDHFQNYFEISKWDIMNNLKSFGAPNNPFRWVRDPTVVNAFYHSQGNSFYFPAGILQPPMYYTGDQIQALNYGGIGMVMGHEITHGFDDTGKQRDELGNLNNWWDQETLENYIQRTQCFAKQYSNYKVEELSEDGLNIFINGNYTLDENIADNGGLREAFKAYQVYVKKNGPEKKLPGMDYNPEQLFFLSFAQAWCGSSTKEELLSDIETEEHSPFPYRVKGVLQNSPEFAKTWGCAPPSESYCRIW